MEEKQNLREMEEKREIRVMEMREMEMETLEAMLKNEKDKEVRSLLIKQFDETEKLRDSKKEKEYELRTKKKRCK